MLCRYGIAAYVFLYAASVALAVIGTQGLFGTEPDGLTAVWMIFLGFPWSIPLSLASLIDVPLIIAQVAVGLAPLINIWLLVIFCRRNR